MKRHRALLLPLLVLPLTLTACEPDDAGDVAEDAADNAGDALEEAGDELGDAARKVERKVDDGFKK